MNRLKKHFQYIVCYDIIFKDRFVNIMQIPKLRKIVLNTGLGKSVVSDRRQIIPALFVLGQTLGQKANITRAKKSVDKFKLREQMPVGGMVTLRNSNMCNFLDCLVNIILPANMEGLSDFTYYKRFKTIESTQGIKKGIGIQNKEENKAALTSIYFSPVRNKNKDYQGRGHRPSLGPQTLTLGFGIKDLFIAFRISREIKETSLGADVLFCITWTGRSASAPSYFLSAFMLPLTI